MILPHPYDPNDLKTTMPPMYMRRPSTVVQTEKSTSLGNPLTRVLTSPLELYWAS